MDIIAKIEKEMTPDRGFPSFRVGDTIKVSVKVKEGAKERVQSFQGICIGVKGGGINKNFRVRKISGGVGVERIFPYHSPTVEAVEVIQEGSVRRAKLYYLRGRVGKNASKVKQKARQAVVAGDRKSVV